MCAIYSCIRKPRAGPCPERARARARLYIHMYMHVACMHICVERARSRSLELTRSRYLELEYKAENYKSVCSLVNVHMYRQYSCI